MTTAAFGTVGTTIRLESGRYLDLLNPKPDDIVIEDIAGALSRICRFGGHVSRFYSVAEHSWHACAQARADGLPVEYQRAALLHDATEAYLGDVVKPLKVLLKDYQWIEGAFTHVILERFRLSRSVAMWDAIKEIDQAMLIAERKALFSRDGVAWAGESDVRSLPVQVRCWNPDQARWEFLGVCADYGIR